MSSPSNPLVQDARVIIKRLPPYLFEPPNAVPFDEVAYVALPAIDPALFTDVVAFTVPPGFNGVVAWKANVFIGGGWVEGTGDVVWQIAIDGVPVRNYQNILASFGSTANPPRTSVLRVLEGQRVSFRVRNNAVVVAGQRVGARLAGWFYPLTEEVEEEIWF
jgi:hypothetical protein